MEIYIMRHGSANRLSKKGIAQVYDAAEKLKNIEFDLIVSSPLMRTVQTSNILSKILGAKVIKDDRITEFNQGIFTGRKYSSLSADELEKKTERSAECGMESLTDIHARVVDFISYIKSSFKGKRLLIVTHDGIASCIEFCSEHKEFNMETYAKFRLLGNAEFKRVEI